MRNEHQTFSLLFWLNRHRCKNGLPTIYLRITVDMKRVEISTTRQVEPKLWNQVGQFVKGNTSDAKAINQQLTIMKADIHRHFLQLQALDKAITAEAVRNAYLGITEKQRTLIEAFDFHNRRFAEKVAVGKKAPASHQRLEIGRAKVLAFLKNQYNQSDKPLADLKHSFIADFEHFLTTKQGMTGNTATKYLKILKQVVKMAVEQGWINQNPFAGFTCRYEDPERERLTMEEVMAIYKADLHIERLREVRDVYIFCCFTGYAYQDVYSLRQDNVTIGIDGEKWIIKNRIKTDNPERVPLLPIPLEIISRYKDHPECSNSGRLLPVNSNQRYNAYLKEIAVLCKVDKHLTTHTARHTFATTITLEHDVPIETVSQLLGHKSIRTTQIYAKVTQRKISNNMQALKHRLVGTAADKAGQKEAK
ncbi:site-specific integrase [Chitinophaga sp. NPDC101104]|uniref:site-specific integrase n=1 Tax=Chitinophaga sp. NPDC101104 TaxID=3390561 RepID=UPI003CFCEF64